MPVTFSITQGLALGDPGAFLDLNAARAIRGLVGVEVEAAGANLPTLIAPHPSEWGPPAFALNGFLSAVHHAFALHYPLVLSPDDVWLAVAQGFASHVRANAERLRPRLVAHQGKARLTVRRDAFVPGGSGNDWPSVFADFSDQIAEHIGPTRDLLVSSFSTTLAVEKAASEVVLMDAMSPYLEYQMRSLCGIPELTLLGTQDDWRALTEKARRLADFECEDWVRALVSVLGRFEEAHAGSADPAFWGSFYKEENASGGPYVTGAVNVFFPYLDRGQKNDKALSWARHDPQAFVNGPAAHDLPPGLSRVPFEWKYLDQTLSMAFLGGFVGASQAPTTLALRPSIGWGVAAGSRAS